MNKPEAIQHEVRPTHAPAATAPLDVACANRSAVGLGVAWITSALGLLAGSETEDPGVAEAGYRDALAALREAGVPVALDRLADGFGLTALDLDLLLLALAPRVAPETGALVAAAEGERRERLLTLDLAERILGSRGDVRERLSPAAPLRRRALLVLSDSAMASERFLFTDERIEGFACGQDWVAPGFLGRVEEPAYAYCPEVQRAAVEDALARLGPQMPARFALQAADGEHGAAATFLAARLGRRLVRLRAEAVPADGEARRAFWALAGREAVLAGIVLQIDVDAADPALVCDAAADFEGPLVFTLRRHCALPPLAFHILLARPAAPDRAECWRVMCGEAIDDATASQLGQDYGLGPDRIAVVAGQAAGDPALARTLARAEARAQLDGLTVRQMPGVRLEDLVIPADVRDALAALVAQARCRETVHRHWGFCSGAARNTGVSALLSGRTGVGKTYAAEAVAGELGRDLCRVDLSTTVSKYIGETEKALGRIFDAAEASGAVLFFDEADALFGKRTEIRDSRDRWANVGVSYLLQRMENYSGVCLLATNLKGQIDIAFLRRLRFVLDLPFPDSGAREAIWRNTFPGGVPVEGLDYAQLARLELAGGNIAVVAVNAAFIAANAGGEVGMREIETAARAEYRKLDKPFPAHWRAGGAS